jgi:hypothetical protein
MFEGRLPAALAERAPKIAESADGRQVWRYEDREYPNIGLNAVVGRPLEEWSMDAARFDEMRRGCWDIKARIADMRGDLGVAELSVADRRILGLGSIPADVMARAHRSTTQVIRAHRRRPTSADHQDPATARRGNRMDRGRAIRHPHRLHAVTAVVADAEFVQRGGGRAGKPVGVRGRGPRCCRGDYGH